MYNVLFLGIILLNVDFASSLYHFNNMKFKLKFHTENKAQIIKICTMNKITNKCYLHDKILNIEKATVYRYTQVQLFQRPHFSIW